MSEWIGKERGRKRVSLSLSTKFRLQCSPFSHVSFRIRVMANSSDSSLTFFQKGSPNQWLWVLSKYSEVLRLKAYATRSHKKNGPEELLKLDSW